MEAARTVSITHRGETSENVESRGQASSVERSWYDEGFVSRERRQIVRRRQRF